MTVLSQNSSPHLFNALDAADGKSDGALSGKVKELQGIVNSSTATPEERMQAVQELKEMEGIDTGALAKLEKIEAEITDSKFRDIAGVGPNAQVDFTQLNSDQIIEIAKFLDQFGLLEHDMSEEDDFDAGKMTMGSVIANAENPNALPHMRASTLSQVMNAVTQTFNSDNSSVNSEALGSIQDSSASGVTDYQTVNENLVEFEKATSDLLASADYVSPQDRAKSIKIVRDNHGTYLPGSDLSKQLATFDGLFDDNGDLKVPLSDADITAATEKFHEEGGLGDGIGTPTFGRILDLQNQKLDAIFSGDLATAATLSPQISVLQQMMQAILSAI